MGLFLIRRHSLPPNLEPKGGDTPYTRGDSRRRLWHRPDCRTDAASSARSASFLNFKVLGRGRHPVYELPLSYENMSTGNWEEIARNKRQALLNKIPDEYRIPRELAPPASQLNVAVWPRESGWFTQRELEITESTATTILQKVAARQWTAEEVTRAFCKRAAASHQLVSLNKRARRFD